MSAYALGLLSGVRLNADIEAYLRQIDATLAPLGGQFLVHGARAQVMEGAFEQDLVLIAFPDMASARAWYASPAYAAILPLRTRSTGGTVLLIHGVAEGHVATDLLAKLQAAQGTGPGQARASMA